MTPDSGRGLRMTPDGGRGRRMTPDSGMDRRTTPDSGRGRRMTPDRSCSSRSPTRSNSRSRSMSETRCNDVVPATPEKYDPEHPTETDSENINSNNKSNNSSNYNSNYNSNNNSNNSSNNSSSNNSSNNSQNNSNNKGKNKWMEAPPQDLLSEHEREQKTRQRARYLREICATDSMSSSKPKKPMPAAVNDDMMELDEEYPGEAPDRTQPIDALNGQVNAALVEVFGDIFARQIQETNFLRLEKAVEQKNMVSCYS